MNQSKIDNFLRKTKKKEETFKSKPKKPASIFKKALESQISSATIEIKSPELVEENKE